jgi:hypothetical protein
VATKTTPVGQTRAEYMRIDQALQYGFGDESRWRCVRQRLSCLGVREGTVRLELRDLITAMSAVIEMSANSIAILSLGF